MDGNINLLFRPAVFAVVWSAGISSSVFAPPCGTQLIVPLGWAMLNLHLALSMSNEMMSAHGGSSSVL